MKKSQSSTKRSQSSLIWGWIPDSITALASAIKDVCLIPSAMREAKLKTIRQAIDVIAYAQKQGVQTEQLSELLKSVAKSGSSKKKGASRKTRKLAG